MYVVSRFKWYTFLFFFSSRRRHTRFDCDWSSDVCSSDLRCVHFAEGGEAAHGQGLLRLGRGGAVGALRRGGHRVGRSEEHTSELQSQSNLVCRLLLEKNNTWIGSKISMSSSTTTTCLVSV